MLAFGRGGPSRPSGPPEYNKWATCSLVSFLECIRFPVCKRTTRFQDSKIAYPVCWQSEPKISGAGEGGCENLLGIIPWTRRATIHTPVVSCPWQVDNIFPYWGNFPLLHLLPYFPYSKATSTLLSGRKKSELQQLVGVATLRGNGQSRKRTAF